jgi:hypothetical protein
MVVLLPELEDLVVQVYVACISECIKKLFFPASKGFSWMASMIFTAVNFFRFHSLII